MVSNRARLLSTAALALAFYPLPAMAQAVQEAAAEDPEQGDDTPVAQLDTIVVTAQRREESAQSAAVPVDVVSQDALLEAGVTDPSRLSDLVPDLSVTPSAGGIRFYFLRGVGNFTATSFSDPTVATNYDNVYVGRPTATSGLFYDLERIEVLKGPQGTLYGRNATGGVINVIPQKPQLGEFSGFINGTVENYDAYTLEGAVNLPIGDKAAARISGAIVDRDGFKSDGTYDEERESLRAQFAAEISPDLSFRISGDYVHLGGIGAGPNYDTVYAFNPAAGGYIPIPSPLDTETGIYDPLAQQLRQTISAGPAGRPLNPISPLGFQDSDAFGITTEIEWRTDIGTFTAIPAWRQNEIDSRSIAAGYTVDLDETDEQFSLELRFAGESIGIFDYTVGGLFYDETQEGRYAINLQAVGLYEDFEASTESYAAYGRVTANLTEQFRLVGGLRYTEDKKSGSGVSEQLVIVCTIMTPMGPSCPNTPLLPFAETLADVPLPVPPRGGVAPIPGAGSIVVRDTTFLNDELSNSRVTYRAAVEYDIAPRSLVYASVESGFRSGGFSFAEGFETFNPEFITAYTIGTKNRFYDNRVQLNAELFFWEYEDQQIAHFGVDLGGGQANFTENIGESTTQGIEVSGSFLAGPNTLLNAQVQYLDAQFDDFEYLAPQGALPVLTGCPQSANPATPGTVSVNCSGFPAYNAPEWTIDIGAEQTFDIQDFKLVVGANSQYRSERYIGFEFLDEQLIDSSWQSNARIAFSPQDEAWTVEAFVRNIEDNDYSLNSFLDTVSNSLFAATVAPRTYGVRANVRF